MGFKPKHTNLKVANMFKKVIGSIAVGMLCISSAASSQVVVVVNPANDAAIDAKVVKRIFLGKEKSFSNGSAIEAINLAPSSATRGEFDEKVVGRSSSQVSAYWSKLVFTGKGVPPSELNSDADVIAAVAANPNAIGYVDASSVTDGVKAISLD